MPIKVLKAEYYFLCPININDWSLFARNLEQRMWQRDNKYRSYSIKPLQASFLGKGQSGDFPINPGLSMRGFLQDSGNSDISSLNCSISFVDNKGKTIKGIGNTFKIVSSTRLFISPNKRSAVLYLKLLSSPNTLDEVEEAIYTLHKTDPKQIPYISTNKIEGMPTLTLRGVIESILPYNGFSFESESRFITSAYARVDGSNNAYSIDEIKDSLARISLSKNKEYAITTAMRNKVFPVFENVLTCTSREGFAGVYISKDPEHETDFLNNFGNTFELSYLPLYITTILVDHIYIGALRHIDSVATDLSEQDCLRQARIVITIPPSPYEHLNNQMSRILEGRELEFKYGVIKDSILARKEQIEFQRLQLEKERNDNLIRERENRRLLEEERKTQAEARDRRINLLLGFIGIGQVVFAILQLLGANNVLGDSFSQSSLLNIITCVMLAFFTIMIFYLIVKLFREHQK